MEDIRPENCRNRLRDEGKAYPKSGCGHCKNGGLLGCPLENNPKQIFSPSELREDELRAIHSRLDVHKEVIGTAIAWLAMELGTRNVTTLLDMLEESQNPFDLTPQPHE